MNNATATLQILLAQSKFKNALWSFLPSSLSRDEKNFEKIPIRTLSFNMMWLMVMHYSWFIPILKKYSLEMQNAILSLLPIHLSRKISAILSETSISPSKLSNFAAFFLLSDLERKLRPRTLLDEAFLPSSSLNVLLYLPSSQIKALIDILGLYDLANEIKTIVDKNLILKIENMLSQKQLLFLNHCIKNPLKYVSTTHQELKEWNGTKKIFQYIMHRKGLSLLARSIANENTSFIWYLLRRMDTGRASYIEKDLKKENIKENSTYFKNQLIYCIKVLTK